MDDHRNNQRVVFNHPLQVGFPGKEQWLTAETLNHCADGVCFQSRAPFRPGSAVMIRIVEWDLRDTPPERYSGLKGVALAEVKWCRPAPDEGDGVYNVGVCYYPNYY